MPAYFIALSTVKDPVALGDYIARSGPIVARAGGQLVTVGDVAEVMVGRFEHGRVAVFRFPDGEAMDAWFHDPEYQALADLRSRAADMVFLKVPEYAGLFPDE